MDASSIRIPNVNARTILEEFIKNWIIPHVLASLPEIIVVLTNIIEKAIIEVDDIETEQDSLLHYCIFIFFPPHIDEGANRWWNACDNELLIQTEMVKEFDNVIKAYNK